MIEIKNLGIEFAGFALRDITLRIEKGEYFIILGPTGAGKTLLLESIAGLYPLGTGDIIIRGQSVSDKPPEKRGISIVYQDQALFPHMLVKENILFGLKLQKASVEKQSAALKWLNDLLGIEHLLHRRPASLSGGERQKVALARALSIEPEILLLDEPLSALDPANREKLQDELKRLHDELNLTILHVTHDFEEALTLGQRIAILHEGRVGQVGSPDDIFLRPESCFVASYTMSRNIYEGRVKRDVTGRTVFETGDWKIEVATERTTANFACIRPEFIEIVPTEIMNAKNIFPGTVINLANRGAYYMARVNLPPEVVCYIPHSSNLNLKTGHQVWLKFSPEAVQLFEDYSTVEDKSS